MSVSRRMARSILRSMREIVGEPAYESAMRDQPELKSDWAPIEDWQKIATTFEDRPAPAA